VAGPAFGEAGAAEPGADPPRHQKRYAGPFHLLREDPFDQSPIGRKVDRPGVAERLQHRRNIGDALASGHRRDAVIEEDDEDVSIVDDGVDQPQKAGVGEGVVADEGDPLLAEAGGDSHRGAEAVDDVHCRGVPDRPDATPGISRHRDREVSNRLVDRPKGAVVADVL